MSKSKKPRKNLYNPEWEDHYKKVQRAKKARERNAQKGIASPVRTKSGLVTPSSGSKSGKCTVRKMTEEELEKYK